MNQKANALQSVIGVFLHSCKTPEKVVETLARMGISISLTSIHRANQSLYEESAETISHLGRCLLVGFGYDNFDVNLKPSVSTVEKLGDSLKHLMSMLVFPLQHGITLDDLHCSEDLWKKSALNPHGSVPRHTWEELLKAVQPKHTPGLSHPLNITPHAQASHTAEPAGRTTSEEFNAWMFLHDLVNHGPLYFASFRSEIGQPPEVESIPLVETPITPMHAMDVNNSTVAGNIGAIKQILAQAGIADIHNPEFVGIDTKDMRDVKDYIVLFHGDLGTGEHIQSLQLRCSIESSPWRRFQFVIFILGLFHVKMACADAIWRIFIQSLNGCLDETCMMEDITILRPKETGTISSKPTFRQMHQVIQHTGICRRLDCWRVEAAQRNPLHTSLEEFAKSKSSLNELQSIAVIATRKYVASRLLGRLRRQPTGQRDEQWENATLLNKYCLLYEELLYAMNHGDIGRVEANFIPWIHIIKVVGKHKYTTHLTQYLYSTRFVYPPGLSRTVRYNILVNPTGKNGKWRAVDWCVEFNNLQTKSEHGGEGSNRTVARIIKESPLIQVYHDAKEKISNNILLDHLTSAHADPNMARTFESVSRHLAEATPHKIKPGRQTAFTIDDMIDKGAAKLPATPVPVAEIELDDIVGDGLSAQPDADDIIIDL
ncbi:hypothetical protein PC9H_009271 [Pleurotus ostreatus]|uniref:DUF6589 domain-containing protein n=1 Tax=Pleurotus ostreatus TaxID=5322 RepID=A0A8H7DRW8_PLEOS|nr:uncharacterized protein PC9H_009271 [Pleurotus ostreatus]KAF7423971.1 hypothetical protein PC9H_009271 [Pleurotus ostreatus]KAJ8693224.1 hypothetical protein PTI98_010463 [Pleurotus ostreatus]